VRLAAFDVDGTLTDGRLIYGADGSEHKAFSVADGLGLKLLQHVGITVALITARQSALVQRRADELGIEYVVQGCADKRIALQQLLDQLQLKSEQSAFMGDDLPDLPALSLAGLATAPTNAHPWVRARVHWCSQLRGGEGAVRELCDLLIEAQGQTAAVLARFGAS